MNEQENRIAREAWTDTYETVPHCDHHMHFASVFLARVDALRAKDGPVAYYDTHTGHISKVRQTVIPLETMRRALQLYFHQQPIQE